MSGKSPPENPESQNIAAKYHMFRKKMLLASLMVRDIIVWYKIHTSAYFEFWCRNVRLIDSVDGGKNQEETTCQLFQ
ncbi:hypothetical protein SDC9_192637 [bioreactor metagenome]|uniref:Uncharacterized protein n=1 Tax=bioreactor metagenome TaxID=1076179 RepID=A0A645I1N9_9ZZZZ